MKRETICLIIACLISFILTSGIMNWRMEIVHAELSDTQQSLAKEVFRFHVIAESDSANDQKIKLKVRDAVLKYMKAHMTRAERRDAKATKAWTLTHKKELTDTADKILKKEKVSYRAKAEVTTCYFPQQGHPTNLQGLGCQPYPGHQRTAYRHHLSALHPPGRRQKTMAAHRRTHQRDCHLGIRVPHRPAGQCRQGCLNDQHLLFRPAHQTQLDGCEQPDSRCHRDAHHPASPPLRHQLSAVLCRRAVHPVALQAHLQPSACLGHPPQALGLGMGNGGGIGGCPGGNHTAGVLLFRQHRLLFRTQLVCRHSRCHGHHLCQSVVAALVLPPAGILPAAGRTGIPAEPHHLCHPACPTADSHAAGSLHRGDKNKHPAIRPHLYCHHCRMLAYSKTSSMPSSPNSSSV